LNWLCSEEPDVCQVIFSVCHWWSVCNYSRCIMGQITWLQCSCCIETGVEFSV